MALSENLKTGLRGEQLAARKLREMGYEIVDANFLTSLGETDIIALDKNKTLCFIEVKTRSPDAYFPPAHAVDKEKRKRLMTNAKAYLKFTKEKFTAVEFDIMEVILHDLYTAEFNLIKNAFGQGEIQIPSPPERNSIKSKIKRLFFNT